MLLDVEVTDAPNGTPHPARRRRVTDTGPMETEGSPTAAPMPGPRAEATGASHGGAATGVVGIVLAAGRGTRLAPFSDGRPKPSFPIGDRSLLRRALDELRPHVDELAVNVSDHLEWFRSHVPPDVHLAHEGDEPLGTGGAILNLLDWIGERDVLVLNADSVHVGDVSAFVAGRDRTPTRLLATHDPRRPDFDGLWRFTGLSSMQRSVLDALGPDSRDLYHHLWVEGLAAGEVEVVPFAGLAVDCGTPAGLLAANLIATGGTSVVEDGAEVAGGIDRCVVLRGARVGPDEHLRMCVLDETTCVDVSTGVVTTR